MWKPCFSGTIAALLIFRELYPKEFLERYWMMSVIEIEDVCF